MEYHLNDARKVPESSGIGLAGFAPVGILAYRLVEVENQ